MSGTQSRHRWGLVTPDSARTKPAGGLNPDEISQDLVKYSGIFDIVSGVCLRRGATLTLCRVGVVAGLGQKLGSGREVARKG